MVFYTQHGGGGWLDRFNLAQHQRAMEMRGQEAQARQSRRANLWALQQGRLADQRRREAEARAHERQLDLLRVQARLRAREQARQQAATRGGRRAAPGGGALAATASEPSVHIGGGRYMPASMAESRRQRMGERALGRGALGYFGALVQDAEAAGVPTPRAAPSGIPMAGRPPGGALAAVRRVGGAPVYERVPTIGGAPVYDRDTAGMLRPRTFPRGSPEAAAGPVATPFEPPRSEAVRQADTVLDTIIQNLPPGSGKRAQAMRLKIVLEDPNADERTKEQIAAQVFELLAAPEPSPGRMRSAPIGETEFGGKIYGAFDERGRISAINPGTVNPDGTRTPWSLTPVLWQ